MRVRILKSPFRTSQKPTQVVKTFDDWEANDEVDADFWYAKDLNQPN